MARCDAWRFGSAGGRYVDQVERATVLELLAGAARREPILDPPCGTGRLLTTLVSAGFTRVTGADTSPGSRSCGRRACSRSRASPTGSSGPLVPAVAFLERRVPAAACTKVFFLARRIR